MSSLFNERRMFHRCLRCGHRWLGREQFQGSRERPVRCASCRSPLWATPRRIRPRDIEDVRKVATVLDDWRAAKLEVTLHLYPDNERYPDPTRRVSIYVRRGAEGIASYWGATVEECVQGAEPEVRSYMANPSHIGAGKDSAT